MTNKGTTARPTETGFSFRTAGRISVAAVFMSLCVFWGSTYAQCNTNPIYASHLPQDYCAHTEFEVSPGWDNATGCPALDITYWHDLSYQATWPRPHGIFVSVSAPATIASATGTSGSWWYSPAPSQSLGTQDVCWDKPRVSGDLNAIPYGSQVTFRVVVCNAPPGGFTATLREMYACFGDSWICETTYPYVPGCQCGIANIKLNGASASPGQTICLNATAGLTFGFDASCTGTGCDGIKGWGWELKNLTTEQVYSNNYSALNSGANATFVHTVGLPGVSAGGYQLTVWLLCKDDKKCSQWVKFIGPFTLSSAELCEGEHATLNLSPVLSGAVTVEWFQASYPCPAWPGPGWIPLTTGQQNGFALITSPMYGPVCYAAKITVGGNECYSTVGTVTVCPPLSGSDVITASPVGPYLDLYLDPSDGSNRACKKWKGKLTLPQIACPTTVTWTYALNDGPAAVIPCTQPCYEVPTGLLVRPPTSSELCANKYTFTANIDNACDNPPLTFTIFVDKPTTVGTITANPVGSGTASQPVICQNGGTVLTYDNGGKCGRIVKWEFRERMPSGTWTPWADLTGAGASHSYSTTGTGGFERTMRYRVWVQNGACAPKHTQPITVTVKPKLTVKIVTIPNKLTICQPPALILKAVPSYTTGVTYEWYHDDELITGATGQTIVANAYGSGNYQVIAIDPDCGEAESDVIHICGMPKVSIVGPCGICEGGTVTLEAKVCSCCEPYTFRWYYGTSPNPISTSNVVTYNKPGTYVVVVKHADCVAKVKYEVKLCSEIPAPACQCGISNIKLNGVSVGSEQTVTIDASAGLTFSFDASCTGTNCDGILGWGWKLENLSTGQVYSNSHSALNSGSNATFEHTVGLPHASTNGYRLTLEVACKDYTKCSTWVKFLNVP